MTARRGRAAVVVPVVAALAAAGVLLRREVARFEQPPTVVDPEGGDPACRAFLGGR